MAADGRLIKHITKGKAMVHLLRRKPHMLPQQNCLSQTGPTVSVDRSPGLLSPTLACCHIAI